MLVLMLAANLAGCQSPLVDTTGPLAVRSVTVEAAPQAGSVADFGPPLRQSVAAQPVGVDPSGRPSVVGIVVTGARRTDRTAAHLVGTADTITTRAAVRDPPGGELPAFDHPTRVDPSPAGIVGSDRASRSERAAVDETLVEVYAISLRRLTCGDAAAHRAVRRAETVAGAVRPGGRRSGLLTGVPPPGVAPIARARREA